jgi:hypothetical protein
MNKNKLVFLISIILVVILGLISLPTFDVKVNNRTYSYPGIDLGTFGVKSSIGNMKKGQGIFSSREVHSLINFPETSTLSEEKKGEYVKSFLDVIQERLNYTNLYDIKVRSEVKDGEYFIVLNFPDKYSDVKNLTSYLTNKGEITFSVPPTTNEAGEFVAGADINLKDFNVTSKIEIDNEVVNLSDGSTQILYYLTFKFDESVEADLTNAFSNDNQYILMTIDNNISYFVTRKISQQTGDYKDTTVNALLSSSGQESDVFTKQSELLLLNITKTYFLQSKALEYGVTVQEEIKTIAPEFSIEGASVVAITLVISALVLGVLLVNKLRFKRIIALGIFVSLTVFLSIFMLKIFAATISISLVLGFIFSYALIFYISYSLIKLEELDEYSSYINKVVLYSLSLIAAIFILSGIFTTLSYATDFVGMMLVSALSLVIILKVFSKSVFSFYNNEIQLLPKFNKRLKWKKLKISK